MCFVKEQSQTILMSWVQCGHGMNGARTHHLRVTKQLLYHWATTTGLTGHKTFNQFDWPLFEWPSPTHPDHELELIINHTTSNIFIWSFGWMFSNKFSVQIKKKKNTSACWQDRQFLTILLSIGFKILWNYLNFYGEIFMDIVSVHCNNTWIVYFKIKNCGFKFVG